MDETAPRLVRFDRGSRSNVRILSGPPESVSMRAGLVALDPGNSVGMHCTDEFEELIIVLEGEGQATVEGGGILDIHGGDAVYVPPRTQHNICSSGKEQLRYIYVVAKARE